MMHKKGNTGSVIIGAVLRKRFSDLKREEGLTYDKAARSVGLHSPQHLHRICKGTLPVQYYMLDGLAKVLRLENDSLTLLWNIGRLLDERVPASRLGLLCPYTSFVSGSTNETPGDPAGPGHGRDAGVPGNRRGPGDAAVGGDRLDIGLIVKLIENSASLFGETAGDDGRLRKLSLVIAKFVSVALTTVSFSLIRMITATQRFCSPFPHRVFPNTYILAH